MIFNDVRNDLIKKDKVLKLNLTNASKALNNDPDNHALNDNDSCKEQMNNFMDSKTKLPSSAEVFPTKLWVKSLTINSFWRKITMHKSK